MLTQEQIHELAAYISVSLAKNSPFVVHTIPPVDIAIFAKVLEECINNYFKAKENATT